MQSRYFILNHSFVGVNQHPSGHDLTAFLNCFVLNCSFKLCFKDLTDDKYIFESEVPGEVFGDDSILSWREEINKQFNMISIAGWFKENLGQKMTLADKGEVDIKSISISEASYLKRTFVKREGYLTAPLDKESIVNRLLWYRGDDQEEQLCQNVDGALREAAIHGQEYFNHLRKLIKQRFSVVGYTYSGHEYSYYWNEWYKSCYLD